MALSECFERMDAIGVHTAENRARKILKYFEHFAVLKFLTIFENNEISIFDLIQESS